MKRPNKMLNMSHLRKQPWVVSWAWLLGMPSLLLLAPLPSLAGEEEWESTVSPESLGCPEDPIVTHFCQDYLQLLELLILTVMRLEVLPHPTKQVHLELSKPQHIKQQPIPIISVSRENTGAGCTDNVLEFHLRTIHRMIWNELLTPSPVLGRHEMLPSCEQFSLIREMRMGMTLVLPEVITGEQSCRTEHLVLPLPVLSICR